MLKKVLVANRGEIAIRAFRAAYELGIRTVAVYTPMTGPRCTGRRPTKRTRSGSLAILCTPTWTWRRSSKQPSRSGPTPSTPATVSSPRAPPSPKRAEAGITSWAAVQALDLTGNNSRPPGRTEGRHPRPESVGSLGQPEEAAEAAERIGYPLFVKAAGGGGGRGFRLVERAEDLREAVETAAREAEAAFGDPTVFLEQALIRPRHIEVQVLADAAGEVVHLFERDCSVQRRHQKVLEIAPAPNLEGRLRERLCEAPSVSGAP